MWLYVCVRMYMCDFVCVCVVWWLLYAVFADLRKIEQDPGFLGAIPTNHAMCMRAEIRSCPSVCACVHVETYNVACQQFKWQSTRADATLKENPFAQWLTPRTLTLWHQLPYKGSSQGGTIELLLHDNKLEIPIPGWSWQGVRIWFLWLNRYVLQELSDMFMSYKIVRHTNVV